MFAEQATVLEHHDDRVRLRTVRGQVCGKCAARQGCGQYLFRAEAEVIELENRQLQLERGLQLPTGASVTLTMVEGTVVRLALVFYCLPLVLLLLATAGAAALTSNEAMLALAGFSGLGAGFLILPRGLRWLGRRNTCLPRLRTDAEPACVRAQADAE